MTIKRLIGSSPSQVSRNRDLGTMAFQNKESVQIGNIGSATDVVTLGNGQVTKDASGNVGIGTSSPVAFSEQKHITVNYTGGGTQVSGYNLSVNDTKYASLITYPTNSEGLRIATSTALPMTFQTNGTERMRLDTSGNLGLSATPSAWNSNRKALQIGNASFFNAPSATSYSAVGANVYNNASGADTYISSNYASVYLQNAGTHAWYIAPSGTAGNAITFTQAMTLDASGNLLVGVTSGSRNWIYKNNAGDWALTVQNPSATAYGLNVVLSGNPNNTSQEGFRVEDALAIRMRVYSNGNVQNVNNSYGAISDEKIKENIVDATPKLKDLCKVQVRNYNLKNDENKAKQIGVVAQELETVFPGLVEEDGEGIKGVKYSVFIPMLIKAIQELKAELDATKAEVAALKGV